MYEVEIITGFSAAHRLREYKGKCEHLHGHNYRVHVIARSESPGPGGMVIDFGDMKKAANEIMEKLDHAYLNDISVSCSCVTFSGIVTSTSKSVRSTPRKSLEPPIRYEARVKETRITMASHVNAKMRLFFLAFTRFLFLCSFASFF